MKVKYNRVSTLQQSGNRFSIDNDRYDIILLDKISGSVPFKERPKAVELCKMIEKGLVTEIVVEEFSRLGRNTGDVINTLCWLEEKQINVLVRNISLQSRPNGVKNPIWNLISSVMSSLYEMELENIKERTSVGRLVYVQKGGRLGRPNGSTETELNFLKKESSQKIIKGLKKGLTIREIAMTTKTSTKTVMKVKSLAIKNVQL